MKENRDIEGLTRELRNKDAKVRIEVVKALGDLKQSEGLLEALKDKEWDVLIEAGPSL